jgi:hypothetical protein
MFVFIMRKNTKYLYFSQELWFRIIKFNKDCIFVLYGSKNERI